MKTGACRKGPRQPKEAKGKMDIVRDIVTGSEECKFGYEVRLISSTLCLFFFSFIL